MDQRELAFVIPTYRLRDVCETVEAYDQNFWNNGHSLPMIVFDDSTLATHEKYYALLERTETRNELYYVGPREKEQFISFLRKRLRDKKLDPLVRNLFRPSYGGNRNYTLMYTLGSLMVSADDDMRPHALIENSPESLAQNEVCRGKLVKATERNGHSERSFDILASFKDVLGKTVAEIPGNYEKGEFLVDTSMDLETNTTKGLARENSLLLERGKVSRKGVVKVAQTYRSGTHDLDALDFCEMFLENEQETDFDALNDVYVLVNFRPVVTNKNWRLDCGVAGYDNVFGLPPFFPTRLRFEDYIYRLWVQQDGLIAAHVDAAQNHIKNTYMRNPLPAEVFNEEVANLLKRKIKGSLGKMDDLSISFACDGEVTAQDSEEILTRVGAMHQRFQKAAQTARDEHRKEALTQFATNLEKAFYGFESDFFQQNVSRIVDDVVGQIQGALELWPTLVEIVYFHRRRKGLPLTLVKNVRRD